MASVSKVNYVVRRMQFSDCPQVRQIWDALQTPIQRYGNEIMLNVDPNGTVVAEDVDSGKLIGVCSGIILSDDLAHIGQFSVLDQFRGQGIGMALWQKTLEHIGSDTNVSVYAVPAMVSKYKANYPIELGAILLNNCVNIDHTKLAKNIEGIAVVAIDGNNLDKVVQYDRTITGLNRQTLIECQYRSADTVTAVALDHNENVLGYCVVAETDFCHPSMGRGFARTDQNYAETPNIGELLLGHCMEAMATRSYTNLILRFYETNCHFKNLMNRFHSTKLTEHTLLFSKRVHQFQIDKINCPTVGSFFPC